MCSLKTRRRISFRSADGLHFRYGCIDHSSSPLMVEGIAIKLAAVVGTPLYSSISMRAIGWPPVPRSWRRCLRRVYLAWSCLPLRRVGEEEEQQVE